MASYNKVILIGNLTRDPEVKYTPSQSAICNFSLAVNRKWKDQSGQYQDEVSFIECTMFGKKGEVIGQYVKKGSPIMIEGRLKLDQWQAQDGTNRSKLKVVAESFEFIGGKQQAADAETVPDEPDSTNDFDNNKEEVDDTPF